MRVLMIILLLWLPVMVCGAEKKVKEKVTLNKVPVDASRKELEEDICYTLSEYYEANNLFMKETGGSYNPSTPAGRLARDKDAKHSRLVTLQQRYAKRYEKTFDAFSNPALCPRFQQYR